MWNCERSIYGVSGYGDPELIEDVVLEHVVGGEQDRGYLIPRNLVSIKRSTGELLGTLLLGSQLQFSDEGFRVEGRSVEADPHGRITDYLDSHETWNFSVVPG